MKKILILMQLLPITAYANVPDFKCWDISGVITSTDNSRYVTRYYDQKYDSYRYMTAPDINDEYREYLISSRVSDDGYYYGNVYKDEKGMMYYDIKCKLMH